LDPRPDLFDEDLVEFLEDLAGAIGRAVSRASARQDLEDSERRFRALFDGAVDPIFIHAEDGRYLEVNRSACEVLGYSREELLALRPEDIKPYDYLRLQPNLSRVLKADGQVIFETSHISKRGELIPVEITRQAVDVDGQRLILSSARDLRPRQRAEAEQRRIADAMHQSSEALLIVGPHGQVLYANPAAEELSDGVLREGAIWSDQPALGLTWDEFQTVLMDHASRPPHSWQSVRENPDGRTAVFGLTVSPRLGPAGGVMWYTVTARDESENAELASQLRQSQKLEALGTLAGGVAHDFNNLLVVISGQAQLLKAKMEHDETCLTKVEAIHQAAKKASALTSKLLAFSRKQVLEERIVDVGQLVLDLQKMLRRLLPEDIELEAVAESDQALVMADPSQLEQVIINLVVNARDAVAPGGAIRVDVDVPDGSAPLPCCDLPQAHGPVVRLRVSDNGGGMAPDVASRVFEPFFTTKGDGGTGLGLAMVYGTVKQSGGDVRLDTEPGHGTTVSICLPMAVAEDQAPVSSAAVPLGAGPPRDQRILLAEDEDGVRDLLESVLKARGYYVSSVADGAAAIHHAENCAQALDLLITDVVMPEENGVAVADRVRETHPRCRVLLISGYTEARLDDQVLSDPHSEFLHKPFDPSDLLGKVAELLARS
jgi:PAS domain S-box-containing protein